MPEQQNRRSTDTEVALLHQDMEQVKEALSEIKVEMKSFGTWKAGITAAVALLSFMIAIGTPVVVYLATKGP